MKHQEQKNTGSLSHYDRTVFQELQSSIVLSWSYPQRYHCVSTKTNWKHFFRRLWETEPVDTNLQNSKKQNRFFFFFFSNLVIRLFIRSIRRWQQLVPLTVLQLETAVMSATCAAITSRTGKYSEVTYSCPQGRLHVLHRTRHRGMGIYRRLKPHIKGWKVQRIMLSNATTSQMVCEMFRYSLASFTDSNWECSLYMALEVLFCDLETWFWSSTN